MEKRVLLINPHFERKINGQLPLNLAYLAAALKGAGVLVDVYDANVSKDPLGELEKRMAGLQPTHVAVSRYSPNCRNSIALLEHAHAIDGNAVLVSGGHHERWCGEATREKYPWINHVIGSRHGESDLVRIVSGESAGVDWKALFPAYEEIQDVPSYQFHAGVFGGKRMVPYMSARGCGMGCNFCSSGAYEPVPVPTVLNHMERIVLDNKALFFNDPNFVSDKERTKLLLKSMMERGLPGYLEWGCQTTITEKVSGGLLGMMRQAGCTYMVCALENVSRSALESLNKKIDPDTVALRCRQAVRAGMRVGLYVMFGVHPDMGEDLAMAAKTLEKIDEIRPQFVSYSIYAQYPNIRSAAVDYETFVQSKNPAWEFFDEGHGYHPYCTDEHAQALMGLVEKMHAGPLGGVTIF